MKRLERKKAYKALPPLETINKAREILEKCDLFTMEYHYRYALAGVAGCRVWLGDELISPLSIGTNGKGLTGRYSLASAYGEMMERLENGALFPMRQRRFALKQTDDAPESFMKRLRENDAELLYQFAPDEVWLTPEEAVKASADVLARMLNISEKELYPLVGKLFEGSTTPCVPFYSVDEDKIRLLPAELIWLMTGSNGMCAGNTAREALLQGMSELFERYAIRLIFEKNEPLPIIPPEIFEGTSIYGRLERLTEAGMQYEIRDCSMGMHLPVVGLWVIASDGRRAFKLGADPSLITALERCLTELYQGTDVDISRRFQRETVGHFPAQDASHEEKKRYFGSYMAAVESGLCGWPDSAWRPAPTFAGYGEEMKSTSDEEDFARMLKLMRKLDMPLYVRDNSYLGFPAYQLYIPGVSENSFIFDPTHEELFTWVELARQYRTLICLPMAGTDRLKELATTIRHIRVGTVKPDKWFLSCTEAPIFGHNEILFTSLLYQTVGWYEEAEKLMREYLEQEESSEAPRLLIQAMADYCGMCRQGMPEAEAEIGLTEKHGPVLAARAVHWHFDHDEWSVCFDCDNCKRMEQCRFIEVCKNQRRTQLLMSENCVDQNTLRGLFQYEYE